MKTDHYLHLGAFAVLLLCIFLLHGIWAALAGLVLIPAVISVINNAIMAVGGSLVMMRLNRWGVLIALFSLLAWGYATMESLR